jgi:Telomere resolvase
LYIEPIRVAAYIEQRRGSAPTIPFCPPASYPRPDTQSLFDLLVYRQAVFRFDRHLLCSAYAAICCHRFKPKNMTDDIFIADILGHKLLPGSAALSVGQSYKDFYVT